MSTPTEFQQAYFIQTRNEIDTEKRLRDTTLHFAILVLGAAGFVVLRSDITAVFLRSAHGLALSLSSIAIITSLFLVRREKLRQIADRWFILHGLLQKNPDWLDTSSSLEAEIVKHFSKLKKGQKKIHRYSREDLFLNIAICGPLFASCFLYQRIIGVLTAVLWLLIIWALHTKQHHPTGCE